MLYPVAPCNTLLYFATPCETLQYHAAPCNTLSYRAIPCLTLQYHQHNVISCNNMHHRELPFIPCLISQYLAMITTATDGVSHKVLSCATLMISHRQCLEMCYINCRFSIQTWLQHRSYPSSGWGPDGDWASKLATLRSAGVAHQNLRWIMATFIHTLWVTNWNIFPKVI